MKKLIATVSFFFLLIPYIISAEQADNFIYPMGIWNVSTQHGDQIGDNTWHMGIDLGFEMGAGAPVYASANGVVVDVKERSQFGLVILVEHELPNGSKIVSLYGHLKPSMPLVADGQEVKAGTQLGVLGESWENGGWSPHLHYGIHKNPYNNVWVYYGHVTDPNIANDWYNPVTFIPENLTKDTWLPELTISSDSGQVIDNYLSLSGYATDLGSGVETISISISDDGEKTWQLLSTLSDQSTYPFYYYGSLTDIKDGKIFIKIKAIDNFGNKNKKIIQFINKTNSSITDHVAVVQNAPYVGFVKTLCQTGDVNASLATDSEKMSKADIAIGDVKGTGEQDIILAEDINNTGIIRIKTENDYLLGKFTAFRYKYQKGMRVASGDINGDGIDEIIAGSGPGKTSLVKVFDRYGTLLWQTEPFANSYTSGVDVASGDIDADGVDEVIAGLLSGEKTLIAVLSENGERLQVFRAFEKEYTGGLNITTGDIDADGADEIIAGTAGDRIAEVRVFEADGKRKKIFYTPFGNTFFGSVDVTTSDWDEDRKDEITMSQASAGQAWVKTYRYNNKKKVLFTELVFDENYEGGARIAGM
ncbi:MAG: VCBS repeat domain-containing M23 family metallopeptidase [Patescibacteria group bacterium]|jgi:hypothetical protein